MSLKLVNILDIINFQSHLKIERFFLNPSQKKSGESSKNILTCIVR